MPLWPAMTALETCSARPSSPPPALTSSSPAPGFADVFVAKIVPEPSAVLLLAGAGLAPLLRRRR